MNGVLTAVVSVLLLNATAAAMIALRGRVYNVRVYRPMLLNIALSLVPVAIVGAGAIGLLVLVGVLSGAGSGAVVPPAVLLWVYLVIAAGTWLLFFPNSVYLITELNLNHRERDTPVPLWYDIVQTLTLTVSGLANAVLSLGIVQGVYIAIILDPPAGSGVPLSSWLLAVTMIVLGAIGVYLGRYIRVNSWDVRHPAGLLRKLRTHFEARGRTVEAIGFVFTHALLVALIYVPLFALAASALELQ